MTAGEKGCCQLEPEEVTININDFVDLKDEEKGCSQLEPLLEQEEVTININDFIDLKNEEYPAVPAAIRASGMMGTLLLSIYYVVLQCNVLIFIVKGNLPADPPVPVTVVLFLLIIMTSFGVSFAFVWCILACILPSEKKHGDFDILGAEISVHVCLTSLFTSISLLIFRKQLQHAKVPSYLILVTHLVSLLLLAVALGFALFVIRHQVKYALSRYELKVAPKD